jgi:protein phosphatase
LHPHTSTYIVGVILLQALFPQVATNFLAQDFTALGQYNEPALPLQPKLRQLLTIALASNPEERFSVEQFLELLIETRTLLTKPHLNWQIASHSTVGLSLHRLRNEDNFGVRQSVTGQSQMLLGAIADGMGGMAQGEVASQLAIQTLTNTPWPIKIYSALERQNWLEELVGLANKNITSQVRNGGTTMSVVFAFNQQLHIAHVGDSRIYLIRRQMISQLSEDHSLVAMLLNSGQISYEESLDHPDRNVLIKSLGGQPQLNSGHVQTLSHFGQDNYLTLEDGDILLLCSDGVWDLVPADEMVTIFSKAENLQMAVNQTIDQVLKRGANDNATLVSLQLTMEPPHL